MHETGCTWNCSYLAKTCNNVGGQKGSGCGEYQAFETLEDGIYGFILNIKNKYVDYGLMTADEMNPKYAEDPTWSSKVNNYIEKIKQSISCKHQTDHHKHTPISICFKLYNF